MEFNENPAARETKGNISLETLQIIIKNNIEEFGSLPVSSY
jgi:hypothetical protein